MTSQDKPTLYDALVAAGCEVDNHESDLYVRLTVESRAILNQYPDYAQVQLFHSGRDGQLWIDVPFAFSPWWRARQQRNYDTTPEERMRVVLDLLGYGLKHQDWSVVREVHDRVKFYSCGGEDGRDA